METESSEVVIAVTPSSTETVEENAVTLAEEAIALAQAEAARTVSEVHEDINAVNRELENHEEADKWQMKRLEELSATVMTMDSRLSTLQASVETLIAAQVIQTVAEVQETETPPEPEVAVVSPASDLTKTELPASDAAESPAQEVPPEQPRKRKVRLI